MKQRTLTSIGILAVLILMFVSRLATPFIFEVIIAVIMILCATETSKILSKMNKPNYLTVMGTYPSMAYFVLVYCVYKEQSILQCLVWQAVLLISLFVLTFLISLFFKKQLKEEIKLRKEKSKYTVFALKKAFNTCIGMIYPSLPLLSILFLSMIQNFGDGLPGVENFTGNNLSFFVLLIAFLIPIFADTFALLSGMLFKGPKIAPLISPKKTVAGFVGGTVCTVLLISVIFLILNATKSFSSAFSALNFSVFHIALLAFIGSIFCAVGDFFESFLKRKAKIKDSGNFLPGHGGFLDRYDSQIFCAPIVLVFFILILM
ncbi:MAG: phosphatidate cytidylyltransferase [Clostridia bacterium]